MCVFSKKPKEYSATSKELRLAVERQYPEALILLWDRTYYYRASENWAEVIREALYNIPACTADRFDCENFAMLTCCRINEKNKINSCALVIGQGPNGPHGYNAFIADTSDWAEAPVIYLLEPQTGEIMSPINHSGYVPELFIFS